MVEEAVVKQAADRIAAKVINGVMNKVEKEPETVSVLVVMDFLSIIRLNKDEFETCLKCFTTKLNIMSELQCIKSNDF
ncbi:MAG: hypothetical protein MRQ13_04520 [Candidatus Midichloria sp.]|nr:hypothetical protein [Candidatus Midichloria sp.]